jgi:hypothetical protein
MATNLSVAEADAAEVYRIYRLRDWCSMSPRVRPGGSQRCSQR